jgi:hypothetical protein
MSAARFSNSDEDIHVVIASSVLVRIGSHAAWVVFDFATGARHSIADTSSGPSHRQQSSGAEVRTPPT